MQGEIRRLGAIWLGSVLAGLATLPVGQQAAVPDRTSCTGSTFPKPHVYIQAYVTGYNTVVGQTDGTPCIGALDTNICGRRNVVAAVMLQLGTMVEVNGKKYIAKIELRPSTATALTSTAIRTGSAHIRSRVGPV